ncbi:Exodeoxyribonuclease III [Liberibacter crescens BT-1]|uniref:Exodeoxyribonuclease III n=1 Tax=Liberibacter crescens (strain BT-1) TaxID=1215343 RepID=L0EUG8_LIBCB|nr:exodeoxyribonuclease III [Liberibacter crescens]AGA64006.1 Exodeoxyribonuclease III [Liberibacter crescens BT-1]AMC12316.1 exodeoxyribonuclease III [Liberibacter crescens]
MTFSLVTWNVNSLRLRWPLIERFLKKFSPNIICFQETKCPNHLFPLEAFEKFGYKYFVLHGQKAYNGVAILAQFPLTEELRKGYCNNSDARYVSVLFERFGKRIRLHNFYVPAGGYEPDPIKNPKFSYKIKFLEEMKSIHSDNEVDCSSILVGDLNVAPLENDVWSHKKMLGVVSHTPVETEALLKIMEYGAWIDLIRLHIPEHQKIYTWWSYRAINWEDADRGRRLDHIWSSKDLSCYLNSVEIFKEARGWQRPSDHVPIIAYFNF